MTRTSPCEVDRLTRSLADFAKIVDVLDAHNASFVSVTQQFNTTTSMGRLTLNMLLSFAQFEREIAGERIRDKIAASKKKGMWMGGNVPLGYDVKDRKLIVNETEAATVRLIFRRYAELGSVALLKAELDRLGIVSKRREGAGGRVAGGQHFSRGALYLMLQNRIYRGVGLRLFRRARKLQIRSDLRPTPWLGNPDSNQDRRSQSRFPGPMNPPPLSDDNDRASLRAPSFAAVKGIIHAPGAKPTMKPKSLMLSSPPSQRPRGWVE